MMLRALFERFSRKRIFVRKLPSDLGSRRIFVSPDAALRFWRRDIESTDPFLFRLARKFVKPGAVVWDIGANVGIFSFAAAALAGESGRVISVEADAWLADLLRRSSASFAPVSAPVTILNVAIADKVSIVDFNISQRGRCANFVSGFGGTQTSGSRISYPVIAITLDWMAERFPLPDILKIDIEGMEYLALRGASELLKRKRPIILSEIHDREETAFANLLTENKYDVFDTDLKPLTRLAYDIIAIPHGVIEQ